MRERTRVLILLANLAGGGAERTVVRILSALDRERFEPRLGLLWKEGPFVDQVCPTEIMTPPSFPSQEKAPLAALAFLAPRAHLRFFREFRPHVVMSLTASMNLSAGIALAFRRESCGWVLREGNNTWRMICDDHPQPWAAWARKTLTGFLYRRADRVLAISEGLGSGLSHHFGVHPSQIEVIPNPVDMPDQIPKRRDPDAHLLAIGRLEYQKGFDVLLKALAQMNDKRSRLTILGVGNQDESLRQLALDLGLADRVSFPGFTTNLEEYFARSTAFVLSSRWEGFGCVVIEAMAAGLPVVVTDCDYGPPEIVTHERDGLVVPTDDPERLAQAMDRVVAEPSLAAKLSAGGLERAKDFRLEVIARRYESLWESVLKTP
jgi:glycosyltransferase involved in cell wall biosynthesis